MRKQYNVDIDTVNDKVVLTHDDFVSKELIEFSLNNMLSEYLKEHYGYSEEQIEWVTARRPKLTSLQDWRKENTNLSSSQATLLAKQGKIKQRFGADCFLVGNSYVILEWV